jgi:hypothetical protein
VSGYVVDVRMARRAGMSVISVVVGMRERSMKAVAAMVYGDRQAR